MQIFIPFCYLKLLVHKASAALKVWCQLFQYFQYFFNSSQQFILISKEEVPSFLTLLEPRLEDENQSVCGCAHLAPLPQHVQVLQAVSRQVAQRYLGQQKVLVGLANQSEAQTLDAQPQCTHLFREGVSSPQSDHPAVSLLQGQRLLAGHRLHQQPPRRLPGQRHSTADLPEPETRHIQKHPGNSFM